jgi:hypothetical protein
LSFHQHFYSESPNVCNIIFCFPHHIIHFCAVNIAGSTVVAYCCISKAGCPTSAIIFQKHIAQ